MRMGLISVYHLKVLNDGTYEISKKVHEINNNEMRIQSRFELGNLM